MITVQDCNILDLPRILDRAGSITAVTGQSNIPFMVRRVFYIYDIPSGADRGAHAHKECHQLLVAVAGSFDVELDDGISKRIVTLNRPYVGLHIVPGIWASEKGFASGTVCLVLTSHNYASSDYIRDYNEFLTYKKNDTSNCNC